MLGEQGIDAVPVLTVDHPGSDRIDVDLVLDEVPPATGSG